MLCPCAQPSCPFYFSRWPRRAAHHWFWTPHSQRSRTCHEMVSGLEMWPPHFPLSSSRWVLHDPFGGTCAGLTWLLAWSACQWLAVAWYWRYRHGCTCAMHSWPAPTPSCVPPSSYRLCLRCIASRCPAHQHHPPSQHRHLACSVAGVGGVGVPRSFGGH